MVAAIQKIVMLIGTITVLVLIKMYLPNQWNWFWSSVNAMI